MNADGMPFRGRFGIARAGYGQIACSLLIAAIGAAACAWIEPWLALPWLLLPGFVVFFFRDPRREIARSPSALRSPADGTVDDIGIVECCPFFDGPALRIGIYLSLFSVHVQRAPLEARVVDSFARAGGRVATHRVGELDGNEQHVTVFAPQGLPGARIAVRQIAGPIARGIVNVLAPADEIAAGARFGLIRFGSRVELFVGQALCPAMRSKPGDRVRAGTTILAELVTLANSTVVPSSSTTRSA